MVGSCLPPPDDLWGAEAACVCGFCLWQHFTTSQTFCLKSPSGISYCGSSCWGVCGAPLHPWAYCPCSQPRWEAWQQWQRHCECWGKNWDGTSIWQLLNNKAERSADLALGHWGLSWCDIWVRWYFPTTRRCLSISYALKLKIDKPQIRRAWGMLMGWSWCLRLPLWAGLAECKQLPPQQILQALCFIFPVLRLYRLMGRMCDPACVSITSPVQHLVSNAAASAQLHCLSFHWCTSGKVTPAKCQEILTIPVPCPGSG